VPTQRKISFNANEKLVRQGYKNPETPQVGGQVQLLYRGEKRCWERKSLTARATELRQNG